MDLRKGIDDLCNSIMSKILELEVKRDAIQDKIFTEDRDLTEHEEELHDAIINNICDLNDIWTDLESIKQGFVAE